MSLWITVCHHSASFVMPNGDPRGGFFYPTLTLMINSYSLCSYVFYSCSHGVIGWSVVCDWGFSWSFLPHGSLTTTFYGRRFCKLNIFKPRSLRLLSVLRRRVLSLLLVRRLLLVPFRVFGVCVWSSLYIVFHAGYRGEQGVRTPHP